MGGLVVDKFEKKQFMFNNFGHIPPV